MKNKNSLILSLGSNIRPRENLEKALSLLRKYTLIKSQSRIWKTQAIGSDGPAFLNQAVEVESDLDADRFKSEIIQEIEARLGRIRTDDKYAPRTIDLDIIIVNHEVVDNSLWDHAFIAVPVAEICPRLTNSANQKTILQIVRELKDSSGVELYEG